MFRSSTKSSAKVVEGNLIISLPDAIDPVVWRMPLGEAKTAALEVKSKQDQYVLQLKNAKGDTTDIAPFANKDAATRALMAVSKAMQGAHGHIHTVNHQTSIATAVRAEKTGAELKWLIPLALIILAIFIYSRSSSILPIDYSETGNTTQTTQSQETGVPLSADSILNGM